MEELIDKIYGVESEIVERAKQRFVVANVGDIDKKLDFQNSEEL